MIVSQLSNYLKSSIFDRTSFFLTFLFLAMILLIGLGKSEFTKVRVKGGSKL